MNRKQRRAEQKQGKVLLPSAPSPGVQELFAQALRYHQAGRLNDAEPLYRQILRIDPRHAETHYNLGHALQTQGRSEEAAACYERALASKPNNAKAHSNLGIALQAQGKLEDAISAYGRALTHKPDHAEAHYNLGNALLEQGKPEEAVTCYERALFHKPDYAEAHLNCGNVLKELGRLDEAEASYERALARRPDVAETHYNLGVTFQAQGKLDDAAAAFGRALARRPDYDEAHSNLGVVLQDQGKLEAAAASFGRALTHKPDYVEAHYNLSKVFQAQGKVEEAVASYDRALAHRSDYAEAHYSRALLLLAGGRFEEGWPEYEWRWGIPSLARQRRDFDVPRWQGEDLAGRTILLHAEQGMGDTIQFSRYVPMVAARGGRVVLEVHRPLLRLLSGLAGVDRIVAKGDPLPATDLHCPLMSLPQAFGTRVETIPAPVPYLAVEAERVAAWRDRLPASACRVGIVWQGSPTYRDDHKRSLPLACFAPLANVPGVRLISLQKIHGLDQMERLPAGMAVETLGDDFDEGANAFLDTAAVMSGLDLVVTADTAVAHLAGALDLPVWLPLASDPHWVWLRGRADTPWYPSMRLFRQSFAGDWDSVMAAMAVALGAQEWRR